MGTTPERVALLQLAVDDHVYLVDFMELGSQLTEKEWVRVAETIFCDEKVLKIGKPERWALLSGLSIRLQ